MSDRNLRDRVSSCELMLMADQFSEIELRRLDLNLLLVFSAVMRERSVRRSARRLFLGPSAISMALARLRDAVGDELFVRSQRGMEPTPRAVELWRRIEPALGEVEAALRAGRGFDPGAADTVFRFACPDDLEFLLVPRLLSRLEEEAPGTRLVVRPSEFTGVLERLDTGDAELALGALPGRGIERRHRVLSLYRDGFLAVVDPSVTATEVGLDLATYLELPQILLSPSGVLTGPIDDRLAELGHRRRVVAAVAHFPSIPFILQGRRLLANMPSVAARHFARRFGLAALPLPFGGGDFAVALAWHVRSDADPAQRWFRNLVRELTLALRAEAELSPCADPATAAPASPPPGPPAPCPPT